MLFSAITVLDASSHNPVSGATIFVNGQGQTGTTDNHGQFALEIADGTTYNLTVKASNFTPFAANGLAKGSFTANLQPIPSTQKVEFQFNITPDQASSGTPITFSNGGHPITLVYAFGGLTVSLTRGPQNITGSVSGYQDIDAAVDTSQTQTLTVQLNAIADTGSKQPLLQSVDIEPTADQVLPTLTKEDLPEFIPPSNGQGTYFTMTQARMYIGDLFIDELNFCQFVLQNNKIPIFGYASRDWDAIAQGKSLVQGQFGINFISEGYLYTALQEYSNMAGDGNDVDATTQTLQQSQARLQDLVNKLQNPDPAWTPAMFTAAKAEINNLAASLGPSALQSAKAGIAISTRKRNNDTLHLPGGDYEANATYGDIEFDIVLQYSGAGRTITRRLEKCHLISNESVMDHSGTPIMDNYGFIARRLR